MITFSIITPVYNGQKNIEDTIKSVVQQDAGLYELIIVDGSSTDNTINIIKSFQDKFPANIKYISEPDRGIFDAMNKGISLAQGEYLFFLGAGDTLLPGVLAKTKPMLQFKSELVYGEIYQQAKKYISAGQFDKLRICFDSLPHQATFYHRSVFQKIGTYNINYLVGGDRELNIRCFGDDSIEKRFVDMTIANYEGNGFSTKNSDATFLKDKPKIVLNNLGNEYFNYFNLYNSYPNLISKCWISEKVLRFINDYQYIKVGIFGTGAFGESVCNFFEENNRRFNTKITIKCFFDNNSSKWGQMVCGKDVLQPDKYCLEQVDKVIIASIPGRKQIIKQLIDMGVEQEKITCFI